MKSLLCAVLMSVPMLAGSAVADNPRVAGAPGLVPISDTDPVGVTAPPVDPNAHLGEWTCFDQQTTIVLNLGPDGTIDIDRGSAHGWYTFELEGERSVLTVYRSPPENASDAGVAAMVFDIRFLTADIMRATSPLSPALGIRCQRTSGFAGFAGVAGRSV